MKASKRQTDLFPGELPRRPSRRSAMIVEFFKWPLGRHVSRGVRIERCKKCDKPAAGLETAKGRRWVHVAGYVPGKSGTNMRPHQFCNEFS